MARVGAGRPQRGTAAADAQREPAQARHAPDRERGERHPGRDGGRGQRSRCAQLGPHAERQRHPQQPHADRHLARSFGHQRAGEQRAAGARDAPREQEDTHRIAAAGGEHAAGRRAGDPGGDRVAAPQLGVGAVGRPHDREPAAAAGDLVEDVQRHAERQPAGRRAGERAGEVSQRALQRVSRVPHPDWMHTRWASAQSRGNVSREASG